MHIGEFWQNRTADIIRWPEPEKEEQKDGEAEAPVERRTLSGDHMLRMIRRMARALARLGARTGDTACLPSLRAPEHLALWMACLAGGVRPVLTPGPDALSPGDVPEDVKAIIALPEHKAAFAPLAQRHGARLTTLGGHWTGSFFMLQMVQPETPAPAEEAQTPPETVFINAEGTHALSLAQMLEGARTFQKRHAAALSHSPALLLAPPQETAPATITALLAALMEDRPLYWLTPGEEKRACKEVRRLPRETLALTTENADIPFRDAARLRWITIPGGARGAPTS